MNEKPAKTEEGSREKEEREILEQFYLKVISKIKSRAKRQGE